MSIFSLGKYTVNPQTGRIVGPSGRLIGYTGSDGYTHVATSRTSNRSAHRLIWETVHGPIPAGLQINHINGIKTDNRIANLELVTQQENNVHAYRLGLKKPMHGETNGSAKLTAAQVREIKRRLALGEKQHPLMVDFKISQATVSAIKTSKNWHLVA